MRLGGCDFSGRELNRGILIERDAFHFVQRQRGPGCVGGVCGADQCVQIAERGCAAGRLCVAGRQRERKAERTCP